MNRSIRVKLAAFFLLMIAGTMLCQVIFNVYISKKVFLQTKKSQIEKLYQQLEENYSDDGDHLWSILREAQNVQNILVLITSDDEVIYSMPPALREIPEEIEYIAEPTIRVLSSPRGGEDRMILMTGDIDYRGEVRHVILSASVQAIDDTIVLFTKTNIVISLAIMLLGGAGVVLFARNLSRPIQNIEVVARHVSQLNFDTRADENVSTAELKNLAKSINRMARRLEEMIGQLSAANHQLKDKVADQEKLDQMRKEFIANVSHEMKTPLSMLILYSESLRNDIPGIDRDYYLDTIMEEAQRLNDMVMQLLDISSLENGLSSIHLESLDFSAFVSSVTEKAAVLLKDFAVEMKVEPGIWIQGDEKYLERAVRNYIVNASAHAAPGAEVFIELHREGDSACFSIFNEGEHIAEVDLNRIWDSFYRADPVRTQTDSQRVGLGLYIVKTIVRSHRGSYGVENMERGVRFWFSVPCLAGDGGDTRQTDSGAQERLEGNEI